MLTESIFTLNEAAEQVRLSRWTIWDLLKRGHLVRTKISGKTFIRASELEKLISNKRNPKRKQVRKPKVEAGE